MKKVFLQKIIKMAVASSKPGALVQVDVQTQKSVFQLFEFFCKCACTNY